MTTRATHTEQYPSAKLYSDVCLMLEKTQAQRDALLAAARNLMKIAQANPNDECYLCSESECECWTELGQALAGATGGQA